MTDLSSNLGKADFYKIRFMPKHTRHGDVPVILALGGREAGRSGIRGHLRLLSKPEASLGYMVPGFKQAQMEGIGSAPLAEWIVCLASLKPHSLISSIWEL